MENRIKPNPWTKITYEESVAMQQRIQEEDKRNKDREIRRAFAQRVELDMAGNGQQVFSETLIVNPDGRVNPYMRKGDDKKPLIVLFAGKKDITGEEMLKWVHDLSEEQKHLQVDCKMSEDGGTINYNLRLKDTKPQKKPSPWKKEA